MNFIEAIQSVLGNYVTFSGRAPRSEFWYWNLAVFIVNALLTTLYNAFFHHPLVHQFALVGTVQIGSGPIGKIVSLLIFLPSLAVAVRRLHDSDHSGLWVLILALPIIGWVILLILFVAPSNDKNNRFGPNWWG